jgi:nicotinamide riboside kinase
MIKVKIFFNNKGEPEKFQNDINEWLEEKKIDSLNIKDIKYSTTYDQAMDEYALSALVIYED